MDADPAASPPAASPPVGTEAAPHRAADAATPPPATFRGYVEGLNHQWRVIGWVMSLESPGAPVRVDLLEGAAVLDSAVSDQFRGDLLQADLGDGHHGFTLEIPRALFNGQRHSFAVRVAGVAEPRFLGTLDIALPNRPPARTQHAAAPSAGGVLDAVLGSRDESDRGDPGAQAPELTRVLTDIAAAYDHATALGLLYIHVLRRRIEPDGLQTRLTRLSRSPDQMEAVVNEVVQSEEARGLYAGASGSALPDISCLRVWTRPRRLD